jgi:hypothetical protein
VPFSIEISRTIPKETSMSLVLKGRLGTMTPKEELEKKKPG